MKPPLAKRLARRLAPFYALLLRGYPLRYRRRFGDEMLATFQAAQGEAARAGALALLLLWLRELRDWPASVLGQRLAEDREPGEGQVLQPAILPGDPLPPGLRWPASEAWPVVALFAIYGLAQVVSTYLGPFVFKQPVLWTALTAGMLAATLGLSLAGLILAVLLGFPRWGFAYLGEAFSILALLVSFASTARPAVGVAGVLALAGLTAIPAVRGLLRSAWRDPSLLALACYGFMPIAITIAFDDPFRNNVTGCMLLVAVALPAGAWLYTRSSRGWERYLALWLGAMACLFFALLDLSYFAGGIGVAVTTTADGMTPGGHILALMRNLTLLLLGPALFAAARRGLRIRPAG